MNFLFPAAWSWLGLALPIVALYLIRTRLERRSVSTLLFWEQIPTQSYNSALWRKLRRWLSLLLQLLFLLLVTFALTDPLASWQTAQPARIVFVLDPTASMQAREGKETRWQIALDQLGQRVRRMRAFDSAAILVATDPPQVLSGWTSGKRSLLDALAKAAPAGGSGSLRPALTLARNLQSTQPNSSIMVFTDGVWKSADDAQAGASYAWIGEEQPNTGITHLSARRSFASPDEIRISGEITYHGKQPANGTAELQRNGRLVDIQTISLKPGEVWTHDWNIRAKDVSQFALKLAGFPADALPEDDSATVSVEAVAPVKVVLVSPPNPYLEAALNSLPLIEWARVESISGYPDPTALYIFNRTAPPKDFESANAILINPPSAGFWGTPNGAVDRPLVSESSKDHPLLLHTGFENIALDAATKWTKPPGADVFADSFGDPLLYGRWDDKAHWALLAFNLDGSDLVLRTAFPILLGNAAAALRPARDYSPSTAPGRAESALVRTAPKDLVDKQSAPQPAGGWWLAFPPWWWAIFAACIWLVGEWWLYNRRITE